MPLDDATGAGSSGAGTGDGRDSGTDGRTPPETGTGAGSGEEGGDEFDKDRALSTIRRMREAERAQARQLADAQAALRKHEEANLSEIERATKRAEDAEARARAAEDRYQQAVVRSVVTAEATALGFHNPSVAWKLVDFDDLEFNTEGEPRNVKSLLQKVLKAEPYLVKTGGSGGGADGGAGRGNGGAANSMSDLIRQTAGYQ